MFTPMEGPGFPRRGNKQEDCNPEGLHASVAGKRKPGRVY
jgi:hypothetical protein